MNPNAREFVFNPTAAAWTPPSSVAPPVESNFPPPPAESEQPVNESVEGEEEIDENDPLWKATLQLTLGDRQKAMKLLEDPDALMQYPEIRAIMEQEGGEGDDVELKEVAEGGTGEGDWEAMADKKPAQTSEAVNTPPPAPVQGPGVKAEAGGEGEAEGEEEAGEETDLTGLGEGDPRQHLNLVFIGHVDAGKSTLAGSILYIMGKVDQRTIERYEKEAKERNRESWYLAFLMDTSEEERSKGITVEVGRARFETEVNRYTILDAPGHKNYVPNMISGAAQADVGILVISARRGEFETGFEKGGQTREHALLARTIGVQHLVVVINKMDDPTVEWDIGRYEECVGKLKPYLKSVGYVIKKDVKFLPIAGLSGQNIQKEVDRKVCPWWENMYKTGAHNTTTPTLFATLDSLTLTNRKNDAPFRMPALDRYFERGCVVMGKVESGTLRVGEKIVLAPTKKVAKVDELYVDETRVACAKTGENVMIKFNSINVEDVQKGYVLCYPSSVCPAVAEIKVQLALVDMLEHRPLFTPGYEAVMHVHTVEIEVTCAELVYVIDKARNVKRPFARTGQQCVARLQMPLRTCMETFEVMPSLGRVTLRDEGRTIAIGKILEVIQK